MPYLMPGPVLRPAVKRTRHTQRDANRWYRACHRHSPSSVSSIEQTTAFHGPRFTIAFETDATLMLSAWPDAYYHSTQSSRRQDIPGGMAVNSQAKLSGSQAFRWPPLQFCLELTSGILYSIEQIQEQTTLPESVTMTLSLAVARALYPSSEAPSTCGTIPSQC